MGHHLRLCLFALMALLFLGCTRHPHQDAVVQQEKRACVKSCETRSLACVKACNKSCEDCEILANQSMKDRYMGYRHDRFVQGRAVARQLQSYRDPLQCRKVTCDCQADYRVCAEACSGKIHKRLQVPEPCC